MKSRESQDRFNRMPEVIPNAKDTALIVIDMQYVFAHPDYGVAKTAKERGRFEILNHLFERLPRVIDNIRRMQKVCRGKKIEVIFVNTQSYTQDGRDLSPNYKTKGVQCAPRSKEAQNLEEVKPVGDEIVFTKLSTSAFTSTPIDQVLRYMGIKKLLVTGITTNYCVDTFIRDAYDRGYEVVLIEDCATTVNEKFHEVTCEELDDIFCKVRLSDQIIQTIAKT